MITYETKVHVGRVVAFRVYRFFLQPGGAGRQPGWSKTRLKLHMIKHVPGDIGSVVYVDEDIGGRRVRAKAVIVEAVPGRRLVLQVRKLIRLPAWLVMTFEDVAGGVEVTHSLHIGYRGLGVLLNPLLRLYFPRSFARALDDHFKAEFPRLEDLLYVDTSEW